MSWMTIATILLVTVLFAALLFMVIDHWRHEKMAREQPWEDIWTDSDIRADLDFPRTQEQTQRSWAKRQPDGED